MRITPTTSTDEQRRVGRERAGGRRHRPLAGERAGDGQRRDDQEEPADEHGEPEGRVHPLVFAVMPANAEPLLLPADV